MKITLLGTGDTTGTPVIGCACPACRDAAAGGNSRRTRFSVLVENEYVTTDGEKTIGRLLIDTSPDMRAQLLSQKLSTKQIFHPEGMTSKGVIDAVIWTHGHNDHYGGFGEFYRVQDRIDVYGIRQTVDYIASFFHYLSPEKHYVRFGETFSLIGLDFTLFEVRHEPEICPAGVAITNGRSKIVITGDTNTHIPEKSLAVMDNADLFIADAIVPQDPRFSGIKKHMNASEALALAQKLHAKKTVLTHLSHYYPPHDEAIEKFPLGRDGLSFEPD